MSRLRLPQPPYCLRPETEGWPARLHALHAEAPQQLRVAGLLPDLSRTVAIVGTRYADDDGLHFTRRLARELTEAGCLVISGGARGIDAAAHEGALEAGPTLAMLATGLERAYPSSNQRLFERIARQGALVTEAEDAWAPHPGLFLRRNRLVAALAQRVVVVQAPLRSGALSTASWARRLHRPLWAVPGDPWEPRAAGSLLLLKQGAGLCTGAADLLSTPPLPPTAPPEQLTLQAAPAPRDLEKSPEHPDPRAGAALACDALTPDSRRVLNALGRRPGPVDAICAKTRLDGRRVQVALLHLVLEGLAEELRPGSYRRVPLRGEPEIGGDSEGDWE